MSVSKALQRACTIINLATKPPCDASALDPYLHDDRTKNQATLMFKWKENRDCDETLPNALQLPAAYPGAVPTPYVSIDSTIVKAMVGLAAACMVIEAILLLMFVYKRNAAVIRAAARPFSILILFGRFRVDVCHEHLLTTHA